MTGAIPVHSRLESYRVAAAELPVSTRIAGDPAGAIVVLGSEESWWDAAIRAFDEGAAGVIVSRPVSVPADGLPILEAAASGRPIVIERPLLRADVAWAAIAAEPSAPAAVVVECHAPAAALPSAVRDALGWAHLLGRGVLTLRSAETAGTRGVALLETAEGMPVSIVFAAQSGAPGRGRLRLTALSTTLLEIEGDEAELHFTVTDAASRRTAPARFERPERLALRRAIQAVVHEERPSDLDDLARDAALARGAGLVDAVPLHRSYKRS